MKMQYSGHVIQTETRDNNRKLLVSDINQELFHSKLLRQSLSKLYSDLKYSSMSKNWRST